MPDRPAPPVVVAPAHQGAEPADRNDRYDERLNGHPIGPPWRDVHPLPVLDPNVGRDEAGRRLRFEIVR